MENDEVKINDISIGIKTIEYNDLCKEMTKISEYPISWVEKKKKNKIKYILFKFENYTYMSILESTPNIDLGRMTLLVHDRDITYDNYKSANRFRTNIKRIPGDDAPVDSYCIFIKTFICPYSEHKIYIKSLFIYNDH